MPILGVLRKFEAFLQYFNVFFLCILCIFCMIILLRQKVVCATIYTFSMFSDQPLFLCPYSPAPFETCCVKYVFYYHPSWHWKAIEADIVIFKKNNWLLLPQVWFLWSSWYFSTFVFFLGKIHIKWIFHCTLCYLSKIERQCLFGG